MPAAPAFIVIGNPTNRRVTLFQAALVAQGLQPAQVVPWIDVVEGPGLGALAARPTGAALVRIDSAGEDAEVERALLCRGFTDALAAGAHTISPAELAALPSAHGRILCPRQAHLGFLRVLDDLAAVFASRPDWRVLNPPAVVAELFDKRLTSRRFAALGVPVPESLVTSGAPPPRDHEGLRDAVAGLGWTSTYVKLSCGSSASCLAVYTRHGDREHLMTTIEQAEDGWYNSLRVRRVGEPQRVREILDFLLREGAQIERAVSKARLGGRFFDCRVLVVAGEPTFTVIRQNTHPITNLHLGGTRGDPEALAAAAPPLAIAEAMGSCRRIGAAYPGALHIGVDLMYEPDYAGHRVIEANAFGDLLPNLTHEGLSVYKWEIRAALHSFA